jgi:hypothetical protein
MHPCPASLNQDRALRLRPDRVPKVSIYLPVSCCRLCTCSFDMFPVPSRLLAASRPPLVLVFALQPAARPFDPNPPNPLMAALCPWPHVNPSLLSLILRRPVSSTSSDSTRWISRDRAWPTTPGRALSPLDTSTLVVRAALDIIALSLPLRYEHRAARYPGYTNIDTTGTWSKYPGRPWRESYTGCWAFVKRPPCAVSSLP